MPNTLIVDKALFFAQFVFWNGTFAILLLDLALPYAIARVWGRTGVLDWTRVMLFVSAVFIVGAGWASTLIIHMGLHAWLPVRLLIILSVGLADVLLARVLLRLFESCAKRTVATAAR